MTSIDRTSNVKYEGKYWILNAFTVYTLDSGIDVGPTFINFGFLFWPNSLIKGPMFIKFWKILKKKIYKTSAMAKLM